ncbi:MAG: c-type cytochrome [Burkholderiaceae bacterium]
MARATILACAVCAAATAHAGVEEGRAKAQVCAACHGADGNAVVAGTPSLAGQPRQFLVQALFMYREGTRKNALMTPIAQPLTNADLNDLAAWFSAQKMTAPTAKLDAARTDKARAITEQNNCVACHTASLVGQQHIPRLAGQNKAYLLEQLKGFKASTRGDLDGTMTSAAQALAVEDLELIADYLSTRVAP